MTENQTLGPRGWVSGWAITLLAGLAISTFWGVSTIVVGSALSGQNGHGALTSLLLLPVAFVTPIGIGVFVFAVIFAAPSITIFYVLLRIQVRRYQATLTNRTVTGLFLGTTVLTVIHLFFLFLLNGSSSIRSDDFDLEDMVAISVELSAVTLAIIARPRWFGVP